MEGWGSVEREVVGARRARKGGERRAHCGVRREGGGREGRLKVVFGLEVKEEVVVVDGQERKRGAIVFNLN